jgi:hypothetical protein
LKPYVIAIQATVILVAFGVVDVVKTANADVIKVHPQLQTVVHIESSPEFIAKAEAKEIRKVYKKKEMLSDKELRDILYSVGFRGEKLRQAWAVAMKESTGRPRSHNDNPATGDNSYGLFQINMIDSLGPARREKFNLKSNNDLFDPVRNAEIAFFMSNGGKNWSAWHGITDKTIEWMSKFPG